MKFSTDRLWRFLLITILPLLQGICAALPKAQTSSSPPMTGRSQRPATVADSIRMTVLADPEYTGGGSSRGRVAQFSSDGKRFVVVVRKGNLEKNMNEYSLLLFRTTEAFQFPKPEVLLTMSSSSNREAIFRPTWLDDNDTILFLGEKPHELRQLYSFKCSARELKKLTNHSTSILSFAATSRGSHIVILAEKQTASIITDRARREGIVISNQYLPDLIAGTQDHLDDCDLLVKTKVSADFMPIKIKGNLPPTHPVFLSPNGRYVVILPRMPVIPENWSEYKDDLLKRVLKGGSDLRYVLVDTEEGISQPLIDAPTSPSGPYEAAWLPDSQSIIISGIYLPLNVSDPDQRKARQSSAFAAEIRVPSREVLPIAMRNDLKQPRYDSKIGRLTFEFGHVVNGEPSRVAYRKIGASWEEEKFPSSDLGKGVDLEIRLDEDPNTAPRIVAVNSQSHESHVLLELNPQFRSIRLAAVQHITWKATDGHDVDGGLYRPPDYVPGKKYPLVIQTHGFNPDRFSMDGRFTTAFAAQALANKGFFVVQANEGSTDPKEGNKYFITAQWNPREMASYEGVIDHLDNLGLIDRARVGLIGFSSTCMDVAYAMTHSAYPFAAASLTDGIDAGYFQYIAFSNTESGGLATTFEEINGSSPFGEGLARWMQVAPGFRLDKVRTPVRLVAIQPASLLGEWEWFSGLSRLRKPVELSYIPDGVHILEKPWERMTSQQGNVDWFCFWLKGEEDPDPAKADQYKRWHELRKLQQASEPTSKPN